IIENKADFLLSPVMVQSYIPKKIELRVTIVGENIFTCAIHSQNSEKTKYDWRRYDFENVKHEEYQLPVNVRGKILAFMKKCRLNFGAIDMILTPDNEYVFLEVNPSGQFGWIEKLTGMPIAKSIAELLANPPS
ncbi:MvdD family ATP-grasp ribosomal peptide maturase, partial [Patescibacteria group bacterium]|nr:MvdD family ATP-grasp ribosomal peptide maturase [Patescibacteria group bacterium]